MIEMFEGAKTLEKKMIELCFIFLNFFFQNSNLGYLE